MFKFLSSFFNSSLSVFHMFKKVTDEDGFTHVSYKGKRKKHSKASVSPSFITKGTQYSLQNLDSVMRDIQEELKQSDFLINFKEDLHSVLDEWDLGHLISQNSNEDLSKECNDSAFACNIKQDIDIVCYGLGQFSFCVIARYQLGLLLLLKSILHSTHVYIYDPQFSLEEIDFLKDLGMEVLSVNEEAKRQLKKKSVCFMPHCDLPLYNNILWANWSVKCLSKLVIIGNSFKNYKLNDARGRLKEKAKYVHLANKFLTEIRMNNTFRFSDIFNDLSFHYFKLNSLNRASDHSPCLWTDLDEPGYSDDDCIIKRY